MRPGSGSRLSRSHLPALQHLARSSRFVDYRPRPTRRILQGVRLNFLDRSCSCSNSAFIREVEALPCPGSLSIQILPPIISTSRVEMVNPSPAPSELFDELMYRIGKSLKDDFCFSGAYGRCRCLERKKTNSSSSPCWRSTLTPAPISVFRELIGVANQVGR